LACCIIELRIGEEAEPENAGRFPIDFVVNPGRLRFDLLIEPETVFVRLGRGAETGLVYQAESLEAVAARVFAVVQHLEQVHKAKAVLGDVIPEMLVAATPEVPGVAAHDFVRLERNPAVERLENVSRGLRKVVRRETGEFGFVLGCMLGFAARDEEREKRERASPDRRAPPARRQTAFERSRFHKRNF
jgi:hypothetical protein